MLATLVALSVATVAPQGAWSRPPRPPALRLQQLRGGPGLRVQRRSKAWGSRLLVRRLRELGVAYRKAFPQRPPLVIHDISLRRGGKMPLHSSHRRGDDVDIRLPKRGVRGYRDATPETLDLPRTWFLVDALARSCDVDFIVLDGALIAALRRYGASRGLSRRRLDLLFEGKRRRGWHPARVGAPLVRHFKRHKNHLHVRFRRPGGTLKVQAARRLCGLQVAGPRSRALSSERAIERARRR